VKILGHRGASAFAPENTLAAFQLALDLGAHGIELDVHLTKDEEVVVFHDLKMARMTGQAGRICDYTLEELQRFDFPIPTLEAVYQLVNAHADHPPVINVELKTDTAPYPALPAKLLALAHHASNCDIIYSSFNHYSLLALRQLDASARIGLLYNMGMVDPHKYAAQLRADALHPPWKVVAAFPQMVADCHAAGIAVNVWTVNDLPTLQLLQAAQVDAIITDRLFPCPRAEATL